MKTYCVKCRRDTENIDPKIVRTKNNRLVELKNEDLVKNKNQNIY